MIRRVRLDLCIFVLMSKESQAGKGLKLPRLLYQNTDISFMFFRMKRFLNEQSGLGFCDLKEKWQWKKLQAPTIFLLRNKASAL